MAIFIRMSREGCFDSRWHASTVQIYIENLPERFTQSPEYFLPRFVRIFIFFQIDHGAGGHPPGEPVYEIVEVFRAQSPKHILTDQKLLLKRLYIAVGRYKSPTFSAFDTEGHTDSVPANIFRCLYVTSRTVHTVLFHA